MNRTQLASDVAAETGLTVQQSRAAVDAAVSSITRSLATGEQVTLAGFGSFVGSVLPSRMVRNPQTGGRVRAKKSGRVKFRASQGLKEILAGRAKAPKAAAPSSTKRPAASKAPAGKASSAGPKRSAPKKTTAGTTPAKKKSVTQSGRKS